MKLRYKFAANNNQIHVTNLIHKLVLQNKINKSLTIVAVYFIKLSGYSY